MYNLILLSSQSLWQGSYFVFDVKLCIVHDYSCIDNKYVYVLRQIKIVLCYVMLCYVMLCYVMLCYVMLCYVMLCYVML